MINPIGYRLKYACLDHSLADASAKIITERLKSWATGRCGMSFYYDDRVNDLPLIEALHKKNIQNVSDPSVVGQYWFPPFTVNAPVPLDYREQSFRPGGEVVIYRTRIHEAIHPKNHSISEMTVTAHEIGHHLSIALSGDKSEDSADRASLGLLLNVMDDWMVYVHRITLQVIAENSPRGIRLLKARLENNATNSEVWAQIKTFKGEK